MSYIAESAAVRSHRGKWSRKGFPHRGWRCVDIEDHGELGPTCEMCESQKIRYIHSMEHRDVAGILACGCVCAGNMEGDLAAARERDALMISRAAKRKRWLDRKWKESKKGNDYIKADGYIVTVFYRDGHWNGCVSAEVGDFQKFSRRSYQTSDKAKLAAFDLITGLLTSPDKAD
jgi:hypothetical protein